MSACLPQAVQAAIITVTITGTVSSGNDVTGVFGPSNTDLTGQSFTLVYTFDGTLGTESITATCGSSPCGSEDMGATFTGTAAPASSLSPCTAAVLTIGSGTYALGMFPVVSVSSFVIRNAAPSASYADYSCGAGYENSGYDALQLQVFAAPGSPPFGGTYDWRSPFADSQITGNGSAAIVGVGGSNGTRYSASANLNPTSITVSSGGNTTPSEPPKSLGSTGDTPGACPCGDPISVGTGNLFEQVADYKTTGPNQLGFTRYYNSLGSTTTFAASLGTNWRSNYDRYLRIVSATSVTAERADGQQLTFTSSGGAWASDSDVDLKLVNPGSTWTLTDTTDTVETYTAGASGEALLTTIAARNGYTQTLQYNANNQLVSVTDSYNRSLTLAYQNGLLQTVTTPDGLILTYGYSSSGAKAGVLDRLASVAYSTTPQTSQSYLYENSALPFALTGITDEDGNRYATWTYDSSGRGLTNQHAGGADLTTVVYNDTDGSRMVTNALGQQLLYKFTTLQGVPKVTEIDRQATSTTSAATQAFTYDSNGYTASVTDWNGNQAAYVNDLHGQPTTINEAVGTPQARTTTITYLSNYHLPSQIVTPGLTTNFTYDSSGNLLTRRLTDTTTNTAPYSTGGQTRAWTYTWSNFLLASAQNPRTDVRALTKFSYDGSGALTAVTNALGQATKITQHLPGGLPQKLVDPNGVTTNFTYDPRQRLLTRTMTTAAGPLTTAYSYDPAGNVLSVMLPDGSTLANTYDAAHRITGTADLFKNSIAYTLDALGDRTQTKVSNSGAVVQRQHTGTFDAIGRLLHDIGGVGQTTAYAYDANGNALSITDPLQRVTQQSFDALNRIARITDPAKGNSAISYDAHNRPISVTDPNGNTTSYTYDGFGDVIQEASPARGTTVYRYDPDGNLVQKVDARGAVANYTYDALDRVTATAYPAGAAENVAYTYDQAVGGFGIGRLISVTDAAGTLTRTYDERGNVLSESRIRGTGASAVTLLTKYAYDGSSRIASIAYPSGTAVAYARDSMGRITSMTAEARGGAQPAPVVSKIAYQPFGQPNALTFGNGVAEMRSFDLDYRMTALADAGKAAIQGLTYAYDAANNVRSIVDAVTSGNSQSLGYDALDRLTSATGGYGSLGYTYDSNGNRLTDTRGGVAAGTLADLDGLNSITGLVYNQAGRLATTNAGTKQITQYTYDAFGHRLVRLGSITGTTFFQYDQDGHLLEETDSQGGAQVDYIYLKGRPVATFQPSDGKLYFLHDDRLGTPEIATDAAQAVAWTTIYQPFGQTSGLPSLIVQDLRLPGQENDLDTGLYHNGFRDYTPGWGRYVQSDPIGLGGGMNTYRYGEGNPLKYTDRSGLCIGPFIVVCAELAFDAIEGSALYFDLLETSYAGAGLSDALFAQVEESAFNATIQALALYNNPAVAFFLTAAADPFNIQLPPFYNPYAEAASQLADIIGGGYDFSKDYIENELLEYGSPTVATTPGAIPPLLYFQESFVRSPTTGQSCHP
jgi:RHS repeat-associated protein